ncbi:MAG: membrane protein insertase YidC [Deltaproteobacteria bacterium]|nr:membrane protein insertase YidC [Deltaproteobacteria bacterium]
MEKRALIAVIVSLVILIFYHQYFSPQPPEATKEKAATEKTKPEAGSLPASQEPATIQAQPGKDITVDTPFYTAVFDTRGARLKSYKVKKYLDKIGEGAKPIDLATEALSGGFPFGLMITESNFPFSGEELFQANTERLELGRNRNAGDLQFTWDSPEGMRVIQQMTFYADSYKIDLNLTLSNPSSKTFEGRPVMVWNGKIFTTPGSSSGFACMPGSGGSSASVPAFTTLIKKELQEIELSDVKKGEKRFTQKIPWGRSQDIYFLAAFAPKKAEGTELVMKATSDTTAELRIAGPKAALLPGTEFAQSYALYIGPKELDYLKAFNYDLDRALDFGWFDIVAKPILYAMQFFYKYTGNYGLAIIILTIIIKILFWWPTHISYKSMRDMKKVQPEMAKLRQKFGDDKTRLNKEMMELYKRYKINPMSGCLPMVIQIPIFFALYKVLLYCIEIRHQPFYWWIQDLSAADPYYISPIVMGASMFIQQWMTPTASDPTQAKMMLIMPVVFTFMFLSFPTGLVIYWLFNNLLSIGQQIYINKQPT